MGFEVFEEMLDLADDLRVDVIELDNGAVVIDAGVKAPGGLWAGIFISRICMADLADIQIVPYDLKGISVPGIQVTTDHPAVSCMGSQCAMWQIKVDKYFAMGSGPARALARKTKDETLATEEARTKTLRERHLYLHTALSAQERSPLAEQLAAELIKVQWQYLSWKGRRERHFSDVLRAVGEACYE